MEFKYTVVEAKRFLVDKYIKDITLAKEVKFTIEMIEKELDKISDPNSTKLDRELAEMALEMWQFQLDDNIDMLNRRGVVSHE